MHPRFSEQREYSRFDALLNNEHDDSEISHFERTAEGRYSVRTRAASAALAVRPISWRGCAHARRTKKKHGPKCVWHFDMNEAIKKKKEMHIESLARMTKLLEIYKYNCRSFRKVSLCCIAKLFIAVRRQRAARRSSASLGSQLSGSARAQTARKCRARASVAQSSLGACTYIEVSH